MPQAEKSGRYKNTARMGGIFSECYLFFGLVAALSSSVTRIMIPITMPMLSMPMPIYLRFSINALGLKFIFSASHKEIQNQSAGNYGSNLSGYVYTDGLH